MKPKRVTSGTQPERFKITPLGNGRFDVQISENIEEETVTRKRRGADGETTEQEITQYRHSLYTAVVKANDYGSFIAGIIHLKYSLDDETALINKGIADAENAEYTAYREFVGAVKIEAAKYFDNE